MKKFIASINEDGLRLNKFCEKKCPNMPKSMLYKSFRNKRIKVNGKKQTPEYKLSVGDEIELYINDEFFTDTQKNIKKTKTELSVVYEDNNIALIYKPQGLLCHSDNKNQDNIIDMFLYYLSEKGEYSPVNENTFTPALCNRIDQGTEGIVIAAKNYKALTEMNRLIRDNKVCKKYICITNKALNGVFTAYLSRNTQTKKVTVLPYKTENSKEIKTGFKTLQTKNGLHLVECTLFTGRTHQIRAHIAYLGGAILGDKKYGVSNNKLQSQMLCAYKLKFENIENDSYLSYLNGKEFTLEKTFVMDYFNNI